MILVGEVAKNFPDCSLSLAVNLIFHVPGKEM